MRSVAQTMSKYLRDTCPTSTYVGWTFGSGLHGQTPHCWPQRTYHQSSLPLTALEVYRIRQVAMKELHRPAESKWASSFWCPWKQQLAKLIYRLQKCHCCNRQWPVPNSTNGRESLKSLWKQALFQRWTTISDTGKQQLAPATIRGVQSSHRLYRFLQMNFFCTWMISTASPDLFRSC